MKNIVEKLTGLNSVSHLLDDINLLNVVYKAAELQQSHYAIGQPMREDEGFREAHIAHAISASAILQHLTFFPEFPVPTGWIDGVILGKDTIVLCEWKRFYNNAKVLNEFEEQTARMINCDASALLSPYAFQARPQRKRCLWVCDVWSKLDEDLFYEKTDSNWEKGAIVIKLGHPEFYKWVYAYTSI